MIGEFSRFPWHDSELIEVRTNREHPGEKDEVVIVVRSREGEVGRFTFTDCYAFECRMNFGIVAAETIRFGRCSSESPELDAIRGQWKGAGLDLEELVCFEIGTNSTNSRIRVFAMDFSWEVVAEVDELGG